jgi:predicted acylesterase/phospholipase RssA
MPPRRRRRSRLRAPEPDPAPGPNTPAACCRPTAAPPVRHRRTRHPTLHVSFSGGEARGYAHVGTLRAIERLGLRVAEVSGSSIGALVAALVAVGYAPAEIARLGTTLRRRDFLRYAWPERRIVANWFCRRARRRPPGWWSVAPYRRTVDRLLGHARFRDLRLPCTIQATDLTHARPICFSPDATPDAEVALAVSASAALPGLMIPVEWNGRLLADGGAFVRLAELPIQADRIIVSNVCSHDGTPQAITSLTQAVGAYIRAREHATRPPRRARGRPVTMLSYAPLVEPLAPFRRPSPAIVRQIIAEACVVALEALAASASKRSPRA